MVGDKGETIETVSAEVNRLGRLLSKQAQQIISMSSRLHDLELILSGKMDLELKSEPIRLAGKGGKGGDKGGKGGDKGGKGGKGGDKSDKGYKAV